MTRRTTRRDFVKTTAAAASTAWWVAGRPGVAQDSVSANEKMQIACVGVGGKGDSDSRNAAEFNDVIALCDIDENRLDKQAVRFPKAKKYVDYREMFTDLEGKIDIATVSTPDHSHAAASVMAMKQGAHCYTQKPLTWSIEEARVMRKVSAEKGVATQMGNQGTAQNALREAVEVIQSGALGIVEAVHVWTNRPIWPQGTGRPKQAEEIPKGYHWDLFLGPAQERPYHSAYTPFRWRGWLDYGTGALGDMACHTVNMPAMALNLFGPTSVVAEHTGLVDNETYPKSSTINFKFPERENPHGGKFVPCAMTWYDGGRQPVELLEQYKIDPKKFRSGCLVLGSKVSIFSGDDYCGSYNFVGGEAPEKPEQWIPRVRSHEGEFAEYCKDPTNDEKKTLSNFQHASRLTETILLGNAAMRAGSGVELEWDDEQGKFTNVEEANQHLGRKYREGWSL